jgi:hypothetical protein
MKMKPRNGFSRLPADVGTMGFKMVRSIDTKFALHEMLAVNMALKTDLNSRKNLQRSMGLMSNGGLKL